MELSSFCCMYVAIQRVVEIPLQLFPQLSTHCIQLFYFNNFLLRLALPMLFQNITSGHIATDVDYAKFLQFSIICLH